MRKLGWFGNVLGYFWAIWGLSFGGNWNVHKFRVVFDEKLDRRSLPKTLKDDLDQVHLLKLLQEYVACHFAWIFAFVEFWNLDFGQIDELEGRYLLSSIVQEMTYSKDQGAPCPHKKFDRETKKKQVDRMKPIVVINKVDKGSVMYRQGVRWTSYIDSNGWKKAVSHLVRFFFVKFTFLPPRLQGFS